jgi:hypothetical protein
MRYHLAEVLEMPHLQVVYTGVHTNRIVVKSLRYHNTTPSDYGDCPPDEYSVFFTNVRNLVHDKAEFLYHYWDHRSADSSDARKVLQMPPLLSRRMLIQFYDRLPRQLFYRGSFKFARLARYVTVKSLQEISAELFALETNEERLDYLVDLIRQQKEIALKAWNELEQKDYTEVKWMTDNPGTQFTASFNPVISDPVDWYGEYILPELLSAPPALEEKEETCEIVDFPCD